jgi:hypothetical protein
MCRDHDIVLRSEYTNYLGIALNDFLVFVCTAKCVAQSSNMTLGLIVANVKSVGGVPYNEYTKLYYSIVYPVIAYATTMSVTVVLVWYKIEPRVSF